MAGATERLDAPRVFFGAAVGAGVGALDHPAVAHQAKLGVQYDPCFGVTLSRHWATGVQLATWQYTASGRPAHLHMFAVRLEYLVRGPIEGPVLALGAGPMLTDGIEGGQRLGPGGTALAGWRWEAWDEIAVGLFAGAHGAGYGNGWALNPFVAFEVRFYGRL